MKIKGEAKERFKILNFGLKLKSDWSTFGSNQVSKDQNPPVIGPQVNFVDRTRTNNLKFDWKGPRRRKSWTNLGLEICASLGDRD